ncbi:MAG: hypothetical protein VX726_08295 [Planctomycetota bacterium]|nr:hypothetical protein [Planctomycetota bacterium]
MEPLFVIVLATVLGTLFVLAAVSFRVASQCDHAIRSANVRRAAEAIRASGTADPRADAKAARGDSREPGRRA